MESPVTTARLGPAAAEWVPVETCTLPTIEQPLRVAEFDSLFATALRAVEVPAGAGTRARLVLAGDHDLPARVQRLADAETACCSFFSFTLTPLVTGPRGEDADTAVVALDIEVPDVRADVLAALVDRAEQARRAAA
ncbi:hypothetical protein [Blastococcus jejuensis]